jgi:UDP-N-acetylglucosamine 2-epimerase (non-hydrolysing)
MDAILIEMCFIHQTMDVNMRNPKICVVIGTRPEVIKQVPLYWALQKVFGEHNVVLLSTGQHRELINQALAHFSCCASYDLDVMKSGQNLNSLSGNLIFALNSWLVEYQPHCVIVQGDTSTAWIAAQSCFYLKIPIAHNEAGLRSGDLKNPFPEEANRRFISVVADYHFAPTERARLALLSEGVPERKVIVTGNTGIDSLLWTLRQPIPKLAAEILEEFNRNQWKLVLLTAHRREGAGDSVKSWFQALREFLDSHPDVAIVYPFHPNQLAREALNQFLGKHPRVRLLTSLDYGSTCHLLAKSFFVVTDSGGILEEAATLGVPAVVCRVTTERQEAFDAKVAVLAGYDLDAILPALSWARDRALQSRKTTHLFGDGKSSDRIAQHMKRVLQ